MSVVEIGQKTEDVVLLKGSKKDIKNVDQIMINHDMKLEENAWFPIVVGGGGEVPHPMIFFDIPPSKPMPPPMGHSPT